MNSTEQAVQTYQLRIWIREISPQIWRRLLVRSESTIAQLHNTLQIAFGWSDEHLHQFLIRGKQYGVWKPGGIIFCDNPHQVRLCDFYFRCKERWMYEYDLTDSWQHEIRLEQILPLDTAKYHPICIAGKRRAPLGVCGAMEQKSGLSKSGRRWPLGNNGTGRTDPLFPRGILREGSV